MISQIFHPLTLSLTVQAYWLLPHTPHTPTHTHHTHTHTHTPNALLSQISLLLPHPTICHRTFPTPYKLSLYFSYTLQSVTVLLPHHKSVTILLTHPTICHRTSPAPYNLSLYFSHTLQSVTVLFPHPTNCHCTFPTLYNLSPYFSHILNLSPYFSHPLQSVTVLLTHPTIVWPQKPAKFISTNAVNIFVFVTKTLYVFCAVRSESLCVI